MSYDLLVFIGRFQPVHLGHLSVIRQGLSQAKHLLVLTGSADRPRSTRVPFSAAEREQMVRGCVSAADADRLTVRPLRDVLYNDPVWIRNVHAAVLDTIEERFPSASESDLNIGLIGHSKDNSSYYLRLFPTWGAVNAPNSGGFSATHIRDTFFGQGLAACESLFAECLPDSVAQWLTQFATTPDYAQLVDEQAFVQTYRSQFSGLRYPVQFQTADAVVIQSGHILLVRRGARPGLGQLALPGGFVRVNETLEDAAIRELREETRLKVPGPVLRGSITGREIFDDPYRSTRGRTFTTAFRLDLRPTETLPKVKGGDDAADAFWLPLAQIRSDQMFEDHYDIIQKMVGL